MQIIVYLIFWFINDKKQQTKSHLVQVWILLCFLFPCLLLHSNVSNLFMAEIISMISTKRCIFLAIKCSISYILWPKNAFFSRWITQWHLFSLFHFFCLFFGNVQAIELITSQHSIKKNYFEMGISRFTWHFVVWIAWNVKTWHGLLSRIVHSLLVSTPHVRSVLTVHCSSQKTNTVNSGPWRKWHLHIT